MCFFSISQFFDYRYNLFSDFCQVHMGVLNLQLKVRQVVQLDKNFCLPSAWVENFVLFCPYLQTPRTLFSPSWSQRTTTIPRSGFAGINWSPYQISRRSPKCFKTRKLIQKTNRNDDREWSWNSWRLPITYKSKWWTISQCDFEK